MKTNHERDAAIYNMWKSGKQRKQIAHEFEVTESAIASAMARHRKRNNLPNGRKAGGD
jgi:DNA-binding NarL/FixJ family response regulator